MLTFLGLQINSSTSIAAPTNVDTGAGQLYRGNDKKYIRVWDYFAMHGKRCTVKTLTNQITFYWETIAKLKVRNKTYCQVAENLIKTIEQSTAEPSSLHL